MVLALLYGLCNLSLAHGFPEWHGKDPSILYPQWVEEAKLSPYLTVCAKDLAAKWLLVSTALSVLLRV